MKHKTKLKTEFSGPLVLIALLLLSLTGTAVAQTKLEPGFNLFSPQQDVEIGRQSAKEVEQQMPILDAPRIEDYVTRVGKRLAQRDPGPNFPISSRLWTPRKSMHSPSPAVSCF